jgi:hypothetical protein
MRGILAIVCAAALALGTAGCKEDGTVKPKTNAPPMPTAGPQGVGPNSDGTTSPGTPKPMQKPK